MVRQNVSFVGTILFYTVILSGMALPPLLYVRYVQVTTWYDDVMAIPDRDDCTGHAVSDDPTENAKYIEPNVRAFYTGKSIHYGWFYHDGKWYEPDNYDCNGCKYCTRCDDCKGHFTSKVGIVCDDCDGQ